MASGSQVWTIEPDFAKLQAELDKVAAKEKAVADAAVKLGVSQKEAAKAMSVVERAAQRVQDQLARGREADFAIRMDTATEAVKAANGGLNDFKTKVNLSAEALGKASAAAGALGPEFSGIAAGAQKAVGALGGVASAMQVVGGPVGLALGAALATLTLAWGKHEEQAKKNEEALKATKEEAEKTASTFNQLAKDLFEATLQQKVLNGTLTQAEADIQRAAHGINEAYGPALEGAVNKMDELKAKIAEQQRVIDDAGKSLNNFGGMGSNAGKKIADARAEQERLTAELGRAEDAYDRLQASMNNLGDVKTGNIVLTNAQKNATKADKDATKEAREELERLVAAGNRREAQILNDQEIMADWTAYLKEDAATWADVEAARQKGFEATGDAREAQFIADQERMEKWAEAQEEARQEDLEAVADFADSASTIASSIGKVFDAILDVRADNIEELQERYDTALEDGNTAQAEALEKQIEAEQEAALRAWKIQHALALFAAGLDAVSGVSKAAASAPPPANLIPIGVAVATGAANVAAVAAAPEPTFDDTPQVMRATAAGRTSAAFKGGDFVAAAQTPRGLREQVDRLDGGGRREIVAERMNRVLAGRTVESDISRVTRGIWRRR